MLELPLEAPLGGDEDEVAVEPPIPETDPGYYDVAGFGLERLCQQFRAEEADELDEDP